MEKELLEKYSKDSKNKKELIIKLGKQVNCGNYKTLNKYLDLYKIDTSHFEKAGFKKGNIKPEETSLEDCLVANSNTSRNNLKNKLYKYNLKDRCCELCGQGEIWNGKSLSLILDHINGVPNDNRIENLRIVCPNCNATLDTHCRGSNKIKKEKIDKRTVFRDRSYSRKVIRPDLKTLIGELENSNYTAMGRKYNVSDNCIRKWIKMGDWRNEDAPALEAVMK